MIFGAIALAAAVGWSTQHPPLTSLTTAPTSPPRPRQMAQKLTLSASPSPSEVPSPTHHREHEHERYHPTGTLITAPGHSVEHGHGATLAFQVQVEEGIKEDPKAFARAVEDVLFDRRSWPGRFERVDHGDVDFTVILASADLTDQLCTPLDTAGIYSCFQGQNSVLNDMRWKRGATPYAGDLKGYRIYMINHEVGHALGHDHATCPGSGAKAPVMMQQTKGVSPCVPNPWP